jgi:NAD(P)-dependent dehydrogenase (short-subunit alcohol dehydrogenase family)
MSLDLASLASVRRFAKSLRTAGLPPLRALVCNAAMGVLRGLSYTEDGFETMFGVNHLGHFLLANLLAEDIKAPARIIFVSSGTHDPQAARIGRFIAPQYQQAQALAWPERNGAKKMSEMSRYGTSKLCNVLCAYELDRRLRASGLSTEANPICVNAYTPGVVPTTGMGKGMPAIAHWLVSQRWFVRMLGADLQSEMSAGADLARLVLDKQLERRSSVYFEGAKERRSSAESYDHKKGKELWEGSAELVGLRPEESAILLAGGA